MDLKAVLNKAQTEPAGVVATSADGRIFFIPESDASRLSIPKSALYEAFLASRGEGSESGAEPHDDNCPGVKEWLDTHNPHSAFWRQVCLSYFEYCV
jgi:hypothetical protein